MPREYEYNEDINKVAREILDISETMSVIFCANEEGDKIYYRIVYVNDSFVQFVGRDKDRILSSYYTQNELLSRVAFVVSWLDLDELYKNQISSQDVMYVAKYDTYLRINAYVLHKKYICLEFVDVTEYEVNKKKNERLLREVSEVREKEKYHLELQIETSKKLEYSKRMYKRISETSNDGFTYKNNITNEWYVSDKYKMLFGNYEGSDEGVVKIIEESIGEDDIMAYYVKKNNAIKNQEKSTQIETYIDDLGKWIRMKVYFTYDEDGNVLEEISYYKDVSDDVVQREKLEFWAYYDTLTGLYNRNYFCELVEKAVERSKETQENFFVLSVDIDDFKKINDSLGYECGDELIKSVSNKLKKWSSDKVDIGRFDSDEFAILVHGGNRRDIEILYNSIKREFSKAVYLENDIQLYITFSVGVVEYPIGGRNAKDLIGNANIAMYSLKEKGKNGIMFFEDNMLNSFLQNLHFESMLKRAVEEEKFDLYYQPQYDIKTGKLRGFEALIRWNDETAGYISPGIFIPLAEKNGSIIQIGEWVIRRAFKDYTEVFKEYDFEGIISLNISTVQFKEKNFENTVMALIKEYSIEAGRIEFEITESVFLGEDKRVVELIRRLRNLGIKMSLDDFGTGYSSLSYLKDVTIDTLKIDKSFIDSVINETATNIITSSIISMVQKLGLETIAEGVETYEQLEYLKGIDCDSIQGFLLGKPMDIKSIKNLLECKK